MKICCSLVSYNFVFGFEQTLFTFSWNINYIYCNTHLKYFWRILLIVGTVGCRCFQSFSSKPWSCLQNFITIPTMVPRVFRSVLQGQTFLNDCFCRRRPLHILKQMLSWIFRKKVHIRTIMRLFDFKQNNWGWSTN